MKILSLFDGISIAQQALKNCGIKVDEYYSSEIDKYAIQITQKNFPNTIQLGDVKNIKGENNIFENSGFLNGNREDRGIDLIIAGSPCQDLSIAKKDRQGLQGSRSGLFYEFVRLVKEVKPKYFILENVNSMPKEAKETITRELFGIEPIMINASLVSAQNRKRLFWVGKFWEDNDKGFYGYKQVKIELPEDRGILLRDILEEKVDEKFYVKDKSNTIRTSGRGSGIDDKHNWDTIRIGQLGKGGQADRIYSPDGKSVNLSANGGGGGAKTGLYMINPKMLNFKKNFEKSVSLTGTMYKEPPKIIGDTVISKLTPIECERLQSLPLNFTQKGINEKGEEVLISNTQRYKACGNGFNCAVIEHILKTLNL